MEKKMEERGKRKEQERAEKEEERGEKEGRTQGRHDVAAERAPEAVAPRRDELVAERHAHVHRQAVRAEVEAKVCTHEEGGVSSASLGRGEECGRRGRRGVGEEEEEEAWTRTDPR